MTIVSFATFLAQRRRLLILAALTLALHYLTIDWVGDRLGPQGRRPQPPALVTAQLRLALPEPVASTPLQELQPLPQSLPARPRTRPKAAPKPAASAEPAPVADTAPAPVDTAAPTAPADSATAVAGAGDGANAVGAASATGQDGAAQAQSAAPPSTATAAPPAVVPAPAVSAPPQGARRYKVNLPPSAEFDMQIARVDADGTRWSGVGVMSWRTDGSYYKLTVEAGLSLLITRINALVLTSTGAIDDYGVAPATFTEKIRGRALTATHFNRDAGSITFSAVERSYPLLAGAQDRASVPFQLGGIGRADVNQFGGDIDLLVAEGKEANIFRFHLVGEEELDTRMGKLVTWHLSRPPRPGSYSSQLDIWLAPSLRWYPVQIRNTEASGALTTQTVSNITLIEAGK